MYINIDKLVSFLIIWCIPTFSVVKTYEKMNKEERKKVIITFKSTQFIFTTGFMLMGLFLLSLGRLLSLTVLQGIGGILLVIGGSVCAVQVWHKEKVKSIIVLIVVLFAITLFFI
ncbi:hypothetical protein AB1283_21785 [Bacillus sp. S13(2024)]|uniref:hypothetical protein n=1 Tax=unclassified Bacillus (in: firmicutes) TaxID=185979 RepID=UPI003D1F6CA9